MKKVYVAGPMRGYPEFNFPAFFAASREAHNLVCPQPGFTDTDDQLVVACNLHEFGCSTVQVFNPAVHDHLRYGEKVWKGLTGDLAELEPFGFDLRETLGADLAWIAENADAIYMLRGWEKSKGARAEKALAEALGLEVMYQEGGFTANVLVDEKAGVVNPTSYEVRTTESICAEADRIVVGERRSAYGHPIDNFTLTGQLWAPILGLEEVTAEQVGLCMIQVKVAREAFSPKRDNLVDIAGYAKCNDLIRTARKEVSP